MPADVSSMRRTLRSVPTGGATAVQVTTASTTCGLSNGTLTIGAVTGGTGPYTYSVDGSAFTET